mgnify:CR=1 FL=1
MADTAQDEAAERSRCLTDEYKDFFAGIAQGLYALAVDESLPQEAIDRLAHAADVLPDIDTICDDGGPE